ncbi:MAG TPA: AMP-binding protein [Bacteroidales bacterium]|nr:AMP-binding protein [Bacteroidales bacterium]
MSKTVWQYWEENAQHKPDADAIIHWIPGQEPYRWSFGSLLATAKKFSVVLKGSGITKNEVCALIIRHNPYFYPLYMGVSLLGAIPAVLAYPNPRLHPEKFRQGLEGMAQRSGLDWILTEAPLAGLLKPLLERERSTIKGTHLPLEQNFEDADISGFNVPTGINDTDPFLLQHSSGTTGLQKPVLLSHKAVTDHAEAYGEAIRQSENDKVVSWLPLYHDMGLIAAFHLPMIYGIPSIQIDPFDWVLMPELMIEAASKEKATLAWLPNFAYNLMADKIHDEDIAGFSLSGIRMLINSGEPVRKKSHERFIRKFAKTGLNPSALSTSYGMAETTFAVTQTCAGELSKEVKVNRQALAKGIVKPEPENENARICVSTGTLIRGCEIKIIDNQRNELPSGSMGELAIKSLSLFEGYRNYPEKTAEAMMGAWYLSGDLGFEMDGYYYIIGRKKDMIISAGKNIYPEDIEDAVGHVPGVIPGRVIAFGAESEEFGTELISVIAETITDDEQDKIKLKTNIVMAGMDIDVTISEIYLVPPRWLIKSSAGKPGRSTNKERIMNKEENIKWKL